MKKHPLYEPKITKLRHAMRDENWQLALRIAARFPRLGQQKTDIVRAHEALAHPHFYRQLGREPGELVRRGIAALKTRYGN
jgi:hypothetical protein